MTPHLNRIATAVPAHDVHGAFVALARALLPDDRERRLFGRMVERAGIAHRWSSLRPSSAPDGCAVDADAFYLRGRFPSTAARMERYRREAPALAEAAVRGLGGLGRISHLIVTSCTGLRAPGIDLELVARLGLDPGVERAMVGFMGCQAAVNALRLARHIVRSEPEARVLVVSVELCTLHLQETADLEQVLSFLLFGDGAAAALVTSQPEGLALDGFRTLLVAEADGLITWTVGDQGFDMFLSGEVPARLAGALGPALPALLDGAPAASVRHWAVHPGGRSVLDAVGMALGLPAAALASSREVLLGYGNMSSPSILFVLARVLARAGRGERGCALAFGPGLTAETFRFTVAG